MSSSTARYSVGDTVRLTPRLTGVVKEVKTEGRSITGYEVEYSYEAFADSFSTEWKRRIARKAWADYIERGEMTGIACTESDIEGLVN